MKIKFLLDENLSPRIKVAVQRYATEIDILRVGDETAPSLATSDPEILVYLALAQRLLVSDNRSTIPVHLTAHLAAGRHHWGIVWLRDAQNIGQIAEALYLIWSASEAEEWFDRTDWLPW
jgi:hypothetical protein